MSKNQSVKQNSYLYIRQMVVHTSSILAILFANPIAYAQSTNNAPYSQPSNTYILAQASAPHASRNNNPANILIQIKSVSRTLPIAIGDQAEGWSAYTSSGAMCDWSQVQPQNVPVLRQGELENRKDPNSFTANENRPALIPVKFFCNINRGDEVSITATIYVLIDGNWIPHQFAWQKLIAQ